MKNSEEAWGTDAMGTVREGYDHPAGPEEDVPLQKNALRETLGEAPKGDDLAQLKLALRRKMVLDDYGVTIMNLRNDFDRWLRIILSDDELAQWFGEPMPDYVLQELAAVKETMNR